MNEIVLEMDLLRFVFIFICLTYLIQARKNALQEKIVNYKHDRSKRFLGGSKSTTNITTSASTSSKLNSKTTKLTDTIANNNFSKLMTQLQADSNFIPTSTFRSTSPEEPFKTEFKSSPVKDQGKLYLALQPYNKPPGSNNPNGMSSSTVLPIYYTLPATKTLSASSSTGQENTWPLFQFQGNEGGGVSLKMFYDRNGDGQNQMSTNNVTSFSNNAMDQNVEDELLISHNLDPSVKYTSTTAPSIGERLPPMNYLGYSSESQVPLTKSPYRPTDFDDVNKPDYSITEPRNILNEISLSNDKNQNSPDVQYNIPQTNSFENQPGYKTDIGLTGHNNFHEEPKSFLGYQNGFDSGGSFDTALNRHSENNQLNQPNLEGKNYNSNENVYNTICLRENNVQMQDGAGFLDNNKMGQSYGRYLRSPRSIHKRKYVLSKKSKHKG